MTQPQPHQFKNIEEAIEAFDKIFVEARSHTGVESYVRSEVPPLVDFLISVWASAEAVGMKTLVEETKAYADGYADGAKIHADIFEAGATAERTRILGLMEEMKEVIGHEADKDYIPGKQLEKI